MYINNKFLMSAIFILLCGFFLITTESIAAVVPPQSDCCIASGGMGCDNQACEITVCHGIGNGMCCLEAWDQTCANLANQSCDVCMASPPEPRGCCTDLGEFPDNCSLLTEQQCGEEGGDYRGDDRSCNEVLLCFQPTLEPLDATSEVFTEHTVNATYLLAGIPEEGVLVEFEIISGPNEGTVSEPETNAIMANERQVSVRSSVACTPNADCTTDANGQVSWTYTSSLLGVDTIIASVEGTASNEARNEWILIRNIPTLSEWSLIALTLVLGASAVLYLTLRRRKQSV